MLKMPKSNMTALFRLINENQELFVPVKKANQVNFGLWDDEAEVSLETLKTVKSPKDVFFPQSETLYTCVKDGKKISIKPEELASRDFVVFGMKPCDVRAVDVLDRVFLTEPCDSFYKARRDHGTIVSLACGEPSVSCFCKAFGIDCTEPNADAAIWLTEDSLYWKAMTEKGEKLTETVKSLFEDADAADEEKLDAVKETTKAIVEKLPYSNLSLEGWNGDALTEKFNSPVWEELYKPCLACGTCTFVCPTCQCYDIKDYNTGHEIKRYRCWDSCMYSDFTMMAHGNNRTTQLQRFRQRFMHKLVYFPANNDGMYSCVGCGRCVDKCPSSLNIVKVIKAFEKQEGDK
ncbi:MAG: 4Fe-4S dicluster domain-containing protein [Ruminococcus sp.]|nr:4Fe-4S dicluster domain-containing protein [Ruminococcus sp.]